MLDARPFLQLKAGEAVFRCARPTVRPLSLGISEGASGVTADHATHTIAVYVALSAQSNAALSDNALVLVNDVAADVWTRYRILRNGVSRAAGIWTLYVRTEDALTTTKGSAQDEAKPASAEGWYMP